MAKIDDEGAWLKNLSFDDQLKFLARLSFEITMVGRNSYEPGTDGLSLPMQLRRVNEILNRVTAAQKQLFDGTCPDGFVESLAQWVLAESDADLVVYLRVAWLNAKGIETV